MFKRKERRSDTMAAFAKPVMPAFKVSQGKTRRFLKSKPTSENALKRFEAHRPKAGVSTPHK